MGSAGSGGTCWQVGTTGSRALHELGSAGNRELFDVGSSWKWDLLGLEIAGRGIRPRATRALEIRGSFGGEDCF